MKDSRLCIDDLAREAGLPVHRFPSTEEEVEKAEHALARELSKLSLDEQEKSIFDVHGIATSTLVSDEKTIALSLKELDDEINKISRKEAYHQACFLNEGYVKDPSFRLLFLRAVEFEAAAAAAEMIVQHFEVKRELFGDGDVLAREVRQSDLTRRDLEILNSGYSCQVLPTRDASGRTVLVMNGDLPPLDNILDMARAGFYHTMAVLRDEEAHTKGTVWIVFNMKASIWMDLHGWKEMRRIEAAIPTNFLGGHYCYNSRVLRPFVAGFMIFFNHYDRLRMRTHFGDLDDLHFKLMTFGIPTDVSPMNKDGTWSTEYHLEWLRAHRIQEEKNAAKEELEGIMDDDDDDLVIIPRRFDVLFGKNSRARMSTGTQRARHLVEMFREEYEKAGKFQKTNVAERIITIIHESGGRFLKQDDTNGGGWIEVHDVVARKKVAHWFRHMRSKTTTTDPEEEGDENHPEKRSAEEKPHHSTRSVVPTLRRCDLF